MTTIKLARITVNISALEEERLEELRKLLEEKTGVVYSNSRIFRLLLRSYDFKSLKVGL